MRATRSIKSQEEFNRRLKSQKRVRVTFKLPESIDTAAQAVADREGYARVEDFYAINLSELVRQYVEKLKKQDEVSEVENG